MSLAHQAPVAYFVEAAVRVLTATEPAAAAPAGAVVAAPVIGAAVPLAVAEGVVFAATCVALGLFAAGFLSVVNPNVKPEA